MRGWGEGMKLQGKSLKKKNKKPNIKSRDELSEEADLYADFPLVGLQMSTEKREKINLIPKESHA